LGGGGGGGGGGEKKTPHTFRAPKGGLCKPPRFFFPRKGEEEKKTSPTGSRLVVSGRIRGEKGQESDLGPLLSLLIINPVRKRREKGSGLKISFANQLSSASQEGKRKPNGLKKNHSAHLSGLTETLGRKREKGEEKKKRARSLLSYWTLI